MKKAAYLRPERDWKMEFLDYMLWKLLAFVVLAFIYGYFIGLKK